MSYMKKDEDADQTMIKLDRTSVFQDARLFNTSPISPRQCRTLLTKIAVLLFTGEQFPTNEATTLFFGISKLFQNKDPSLRQMVYLILKELANTAEDVIMSTSIIMKDTAVGSDVVYRANAIRALCRIIDATTVQGIERLIKTAIVDKTPSVSSAAIVSSYHLLPIARDVVRRWQSETQEAASASKQSTGFLGFGGSSQAHAISQSNFMTQYHAIGLLYQMRSHDRMALVKMVQQYGAAGVIKSPAALVLLVRLAAKLADEDPGLRKPMMQMLDGWLRHKHEMVNFEAAKAICDMRDVTDAEASQAVHVLQLFLSSPRAITKFAAIRILHNFATFKPHVVNVCNPDIESLISNSNRSIATFAITTLLKTGNEASVDRLMKQISGFMADITDEFKITIVEAIRTLCLKFPSKQAGMLAFLSGILRDEGGYGRSLFADALSSPYLIRLPPCRDFASLWRERKNSTRVFGPLPLLVNLSDQPISHTHLSFFTLLSFTDLIVARFSESLPRGDNIQTPKRIPIPFQPIRRFLHVLPHGVPPGLLHRRSDSLLNLLATSQLLETVYLPMDCFLALLSIL